MGDKNAEIISWFKDAVGSEKCTVTLEKGIDKGDGFIADIHFATVTLENGEVLRLIAKVSKSSEKMWEFSLDLCQREVLFYEEVVPVLQRFQEDKNVKIPLKAFPKCYKTITKENCEVIIQNNMAAKGFKLHNRRIPMNLNHMKLVLGNYAKFHALSFAIKDQKSELFDKISTILFNDLVTKNIKESEDMYEKASQKVFNNLKEANREDLANRYKKLMKKKSAIMSLDVLEDIPAEKVILHNDCHNGNFLFKYKDNDESNPLDMVMLDFQLSFCFSPIMDLSFYLFTGGSRLELSHLEELLEYYHTQLSSFLRELGSDPDQIFPISTMWDHWKRYSFYGFNLASSFMELLFIEPEEVPDNGNEDLKNLLDVNLKNNKVYLERLVDVVEHYLNFHNVY